MAAKRESDCVKALDPFGLRGTVIDGRYRVECVVGQGGFGVVYRAFHLVFEKPVAIKVLKLPADLAPSAEQELADSFRREGKLMFELCTLHPSIALVLDAGTVLTRHGVAAPYLAVEWLDGVTLHEELQCRKVLGREPFRIEEAVALMHRPAEALALAHKRGIIHRDIKPANLMIAKREDGIVAKVLDFGLAKVIADARGSAAALNEPDASRRGFTPHYASPEQWLRRIGPTGPWTDVHALALVLVEMLSGKPPFDGDDPAGWMLASIDDKNRPSPHNRGVEVPKEVEEVFLRALNVDPDSRFPDVGAFWKELCTAVAWSESNESLSLDKMAFSGMSMDGRSPCARSIGADGFSGDTLRTTGMASHSEEPNLAERPPMSAAASTAGSNPLPPTWMATPVQVPHPPLSSAHRPWFRRRGTLAWAALTIVGLMGWATRWGCSKETTTHRAADVSKSAIDLDGGQDSGGTALSYASTSTASPVPNAGEPSASSVFAARPASVQMGDTRQSAPRTTQQADKRVPAERRRPTEARSSTQGAASLTSKPASPPQSSSRPATTGTSGPSRTDTDSLIRSRLLEGRK